MAAGYVASAAALVLAVRLKPELVERERVALVAIAGTTAYGIFLFSYFVDRSGEHVLAYVSLPALLAATLWMSLVLRWQPSLPRRGVAAALAFALSVAVVMVAAAWSTVEDRFGHTALAHAIPGGDSPGEARARLRDFPAHTAAAPVGDRLLDRHMPGERHSLVIVNPTYATETLIRSDRVNLLPLANLAAWDDGDVARELVPPLRDAIAELKPGQRMLVDKPALAALARAKADPTRDLAPARRTRSWPRSRSMPCCEIDKRFALCARRAGGQGPHGGRADPLALAAPRPSPRQFGRIARARFRRPRRSCRGRTSGRSPPGR